MNRPAGKTLQTIDRALAVIELLSQAPDGMKLSALARELGLKNQTMLGIVRSLQAGDVVMQEQQGGRYFLGPRLSAWQQRWLDNNGPAIAARSTVEAFAHDIGESVMLVELRGAFLLSLVQVNIRNQVMIAVPADSAQALHAMSTSKLLIAFLPEPQRSELIATLDFTPYGPNTLTDPAAFDAALAQIRAEDYAVSYEERAPGVVSLAVPVREPTGRIRAALGLHAPTLRLNDARIGELLAKARQTAGRLEEIWNAQSWDRVML